MISFRDLCKSHNIGAKETQTEYLQNVLYKEKKMPDGLPRASHNKKTGGSPQLHKRIQ